jgi:hypothetical protein
MYDNQYASSVIRVPVGARVTFLNRGRSVHDAVAADGSWKTPAVAPRSGDQGRGADVVFASPGVHPYYCSYHGTRDGRGMAGVVVVGNVPYTPSARGAVAPVDRASGRTLRVPTPYPTIQAAVDAAVPGDLVLIDRGVYREEVTVTTPSLVLRGVDRNEVVIDGEFLRGNGISVLADAVAVENLTARNAVLNGFFWTGVTGFRASYLTAYNNGDYGVYAFGSTDGVFEHSYASGSPDSGFYIGQCNPCRIVLRHLIAERNGLGFSGTNAGGQLYVVSSVWRWNRAGIVPSSLDVELDPPQRDAVFAANLVYSNNNRAAPATSLTAPALGNGILLAGTVRDTVIGNVVLDHEAHGIVTVPILDRNYYRAHGNVIRGNVVLASGRADLANGGPGATGNCFAGNEHQSAAPFGLELARGCDAPLRAPLWADLVPFASGFVRSTRLAGERFPDWKTRPPPPRQPSLPDALTAPARPAMRVFESLGFDLRETPLPAETDSVLAAWRSGVTTAQPPSLLGRLLANASFLTLLGVLAWWLSAAVRRAKPRRHRWPRRFGVLVAGVSAYLLVLAASALFYGRV